MLAEPQNTETPPSETNLKTLVVYYSYTNNCERIIDDLKTQITCDVLEIEPKEKGLRYEANNYAIGTEQLNKINANPNDLSSYPKIDPVSMNLSQYDCILIEKFCHAIPCYQVVILSAVVEVNVIGIGTFQSFSSSKINFFLCSLDLFL